MLRILLAESNSSLRSALKLNLEQEAGITFSAEAADNQSLMLSLSRSEVDIVLLEWGLPGFQSSDITRIHELAPAVKVVVLGRKKSEEASALAAGADRFIQKGSPPRKLIQIINSIQDIKKFTAG